MIYGRFHKRRIRKLDVQLSNPLWMSCLHTMERRLTNYLDHNQWIFENDSIEWRCNHNDLHLEMGQNTYRVVPNFQNHLLDLAPWDWLDFRSVIKIKENHTPLDNLYIFQPNIWY